MIFVIWTNIFINFLFLTTPSTRQLSGQASLPLTTIYHVTNQKSLFCSDDTRVERGEWDSNPHAILGESVDRFDKYVRVL